MQPDLSFDIKDIESGILPELMINSITDMMEYVDSDKVIRWSNMGPFIQKAFGIQDIIGQKCSDVYGTMHGQCERCPIEYVLNTGRRTVSEVKNRLPNGDACWIRSHYYPIQDENGATMGAIRIAFNITDEKKSQAQRDAYLATLESTLESRSRCEPEPPADDLSRRERQILSLLADGLSNQQIAELLDISLNTVKTHVVHIFNKMGVNDRTRAAVEATRLQII